ncbi:hypothetical protein R1sor_016781 [Riccia sorocarpa]|uniref:Clathrin light chain n=1 Tax=Riccia sorocarpa TaxID=122646 RepID=A0ABD3HIS2_9MARC
MASGGSDLGFDSSDDGPPPELPEPEESTEVPESQTIDLNESADYAQFDIGGYFDTAETYGSEYDGEIQHASTSGTEGLDQVDDGFAGFSLRSDGRSVPPESELDPGVGRPTDSLGVSSPVPGWDDTSSLWIHGEDPLEGDGSGGDEPGNSSPSGTPGGDNPGGDDGGGKDDESEENKKDKAVREMLLLKAINAKYLPAFASEENVILHDTVLETELTLRRAEKGTRKLWKSKMTGRPLWRNT